DEHLELSVSGMTCQHCAAAVGRALRECHGVTAVEIDLKAGRAYVTGEHLATDRLLAAVGAAGYAAETPPNQADG
ncbi:MAG: heavy-metal-associated domain-containing protein, partial [Planctomycetaceae bacterium]|nr:heavy-metal-associated domain-containing protein [Planctomycetaceae bacterium]